MKKLNRLCKLFFPWKQKQKIRENTHIPDTFQVTLLLPVILTRLWVKLEQRQKLVTNINKFVNHRHFCNWNFSSLFELPEFLYMEAIWNWFLWLCLLAFRPILKKRKNINFKICSFSHKKMLCKFYFSWMTSDG